MSDNQQGGQINQGQNPQFGQQGGYQAPQSGPSNPAENNQFGQNQGQPQFGQDQGQPQADPNSNFQPGGAAGQGQGDQPWTPPAEPKKKNPLLGRVGGLLVALVLLGGFYALSNAGLLPGGIKVGNCLSIESSGSSDYKHKKVDCGDDSKAPYLVVEKSKSRCAEPYAEYSLTRRGSTTRYCLMPDLKQGKCYTKATSPLQGLVATDCGASAALKVNKRIEGKSDKAACAEGEVAEVYTKDPARTYCYGDPTA